MSDDLLTIIPTDPAWVPSAEQADAARRELATMVRTDDIEWTIEDAVSFFDPGSNFETVECPRCGVEAVDWVFDAIDRAYDASLGGFDDLSIVTPCCAGSASLNDMTFHWPAGFARCALTARNAGIKGWLPDAELAQVAAALGHEVRQIRAHY